MREVHTIASFKKLWYVIFSLIININLVAGAKYELPNYVLSEPTNLIRDSS